MTESGADAQGEGVYGLAEECRATLAEVLDGATSCALVDFPLHSNVGDSAIWLGERRLLSELGVDVRYTCHFGDYRPHILRNRLPVDAPVLIHGGGNFGDLWPDHQRLRTKVIEDFPDRQIVQLPQTLNLTESGTVKRVRSLLRSHGGVTVMCRDGRSVDFAREELSTNARIAPDSAFLLGPLSSRSPDPSTIFWLARDDREQSPDSRPDSAVSQTPEGVKMIVQDWLNEGGLGNRSVLFRLGRYLACRGREQLAEITTLGPLTNRAYLHNYDWQALQRVRRGVAMLSSGSVVVTDRLHGHILSVLLGRPQVLLDNSYGKVRSFCETWGHRYGGVRWAGNASEARELAVDLLRGTALPSTSGW